MRRRWMLVNFCVLVFPSFALGLVSARIVSHAWSFLNSDSHLADVLAVEGSRSLGRPVAVRDVRFLASPWSLLPNRVRLTGVQIGAAVTGQHPLASADEITVWYKPGQILFGTDNTLPLVSDIQLRHPVVFVRRDAAGQWNFARLIKPGPTGGRPFTDRITVSDGTVLYDDGALPRPHGVPGYRLVTQVDHLAGRAQFRPDHSVAYQLVAQGDNNLVSGLASTGIVNANPLRIDVRLQGHGINLPVAARYMLAAERASIQAGRADVDLSLVYDQSEGRALRAFHAGDVGLTGIVHLSGVSVRPAQLLQPASEVNGDLLVTNHIVSGRLSGQFGGAAITVTGSCVGLPQLDGGDQHGVAPSISASGTVQNGDYSKIINALGLRAHLSTLAAKTRRDILTAVATGHLDYQIVGPINRPTASVTGDLRSVRYDRYRSRQIHIQAFYANAIVDADARGEFAGGTAVVRGHVGGTAPGHFEVEAHGRHLNLALVHYLYAGLEGGIADVDFSIRGQRRRTPSITVQAQAANLHLRGQQISSVYVRAATVGRTLQLNPIRVEDDKGFALGSGTVDLSRQKLDINVEADELDIGAIIAAVNRQLEGARSVALPISNRTAQTADHRLADVANQIQGVGYVRAHVGGTFHHPEVTGRLSGFALASGAVDVDQAAIDFELTPDMFRIVSGTAVLYPGELTFTGTMSPLRGDEPVIQLQGNATNFDVNDLLAFAGIRSGATQDPESRTAILIGHVNAGPILVSGTFHDLRITTPATVSLVDGSINGLPFETATASITYDKAGLKLEHVDLAVAGGTATGHGTVGADGALDLDVAGHDFDMVTVLSAIPQAGALLIGGKLGFTGHVFGTTKTVQANAHLTGNSLKYKDFDIGQVQVNAAYSDRQVLVSDAVLLEPGGTPTGPDRVEITDFVYDTSSRAIHGAVKLADVPLERLRRLALRLPYAEQEGAKPIVARLAGVPTPFGGAISSDALVSGSIDEPVVDFTLSGNELVVDQLRLTHLSASGRVDRSRLVMPSPTHQTPGLRIDSPDGILVAKAVTIGLGDDATTKEATTLSADISAYNLNLGAVQHLPNLIPEAGVKELGGFADLFVTASGQRSHPTLQVSANLRNLIYEGRSFDNVLVSNMVIQEPRIQSDAILFTKSYLRNDNTSGKFTGKAQGAIDFQWRSPYIPSDAALNITADLPRQELASLGAVYSIVAGTPTARLSLDTDGQFQASMQITHTLDRPQVLGTVELDADQVRFGEMHTELRSLHGEIDFDRNSVTIPAGFRATTFDTAAGVPQNSRQGTPILLSGSLPIVDPADAPSASGITLREDRVPFNEAPLPGLKAGSLAGEGSVNITVVGSLTHPSIRGTVSVQNSQLLLPGDLGVGNRSGFSVPVNPALDLTLQVGKNVRLRNSALNMRVDGSIALRGRLFQPEPIGSVNPAPNSGSSVRTLAVRLFGALAIRDGRLTLPTARFNIVPPGTLTFNYPTFDPSQPGQQVLGVNVDAKAQTYLVLPSGSSFTGRKRYLVTVSARGPLTGLTEDPTTGRSRLALNFTTDPPDYEGNQQVLQQRLAGALGGEAIEALGRNAGQVVVTQLTNVLTSSVLPNLFDRPARELGFEEISLAYDPIERLSVMLSRHVIGPLYLTYSRSLGETILYDIKASLRFHDRYQLSFEQDEQMTHTVLLEGVWRFW